MTLGQKKEVIFLQLRVFRDGDLEANALNITGPDLAPPSPCHPFVGRENSVSILFQTHRAFTMVDPSRQCIHCMYICTVFKSIIQPSIEACLLTPTGFNYRGPSCSSVRTGRSHASKHKTQHKNPSFTRQGSAFIGNLGTVAGRRVECMSTPVKLVLDG